MSFDFTLLRLLLACSVMVSHHAALTGQPHAIPALSSMLAVQAFFVVSGWIVTASFERSPSMTGFFTRRLARIYPLYAATVLAQCLVACVAVGWPEGWGAQAAHYLAANLAFANFAHPTLLGWLSDAPVKAINPSLWTLKLEVLFYVSVPLLVFARRRLGLWGPALLYAASVAFVALVQSRHPELARQLPGQIRFFLAGMLARIACESLPVLARPGLLLMGLLGAGALLAASALEHETGLVLAQPFLVAAFVAAAARLLPNAAALPDISFGVYLLHAPVIQLANATGLLPPGVPGLTIVGAATAALALVGHLAIEKPAIRLGARLSRRLDSRAAPADRPAATLAKNAAAGS